jgi:glycosyltransferase involved in cell wall biosynthesis
MVLIPAYNAGNYLAELITRITQALPEADLLIINDGSTDNTAELLATINVDMLTNETNRGKGFTLNRGIDYAIKREYDFVITIDADLQHLPEELPSFTNAISDAGIYVGTRKVELKVMPFLRWLTNNLTSMLISIFAGRRIRDSQSGYRMLSFDFLSRMTVVSVKYDFESELLFQTGLLGVKVAEVPVTTVYEGSHSYINPLVDTGRFIKLLWKKLLL